MRRAIALLLPLVSLPALVACSAAKDYPSLARRSAERMTGSAPAVTPEAPPPPPAPPSSQLTSRLAQLVDQAQAAHRRFSARRGSAERLVGSGVGGSPGSEGWSVATIVLSDLESARSDAMVALADLDQLYSRETVAAAESGNNSGVDAIAAARDQVATLVGEEDAILAALRERMRS